MTPLVGTNHFIDALFHKGIIINTPALNPLGGTALEDLLSIFSPVYKTTNPHIMSINETSYLPQYRGLLRRLKEASAEEEVRAKMQLEDGFFEEMQFMEDQLTNALNEKAEEQRQKEAERQQKEEALRKSEAERQQKEEALRKSEAERQQKEEALRMNEEERQQKERAIRLLLDLGMPKEEIGRQLGISDAELNDF